MVGNQIFIFGGLADYPENDAGQHDNLTLTSYSVLSYDSEKRCWQWVVTDKDYPAHICPPAVTPYFEAALPMADGVNILLTPSRKSRWHGVSNSAGFSSIILNLRFPPGR